MRGENQPEGRQGMKNGGGAISSINSTSRYWTMLQHDARMTNQDLADAVGLSPSACLQRVKRLEKAGIIASYRVHLDLNVSAAMSMSSPR